MTDIYAQYFKAWSTKTHGTRPTADLLNTAHAFGRPGKQSLVLAMALRPEGMTRPQMLHACGAPQMNHVFGKAGLVAAGLAKRDMSAGYNAAGAMVYRITLTPKGLARVAKATGAAVTVPEAKAPAKAKAVSKPRKVKAPVTAAPVVPQGEAAPPVGSTVN